MAAMPQQWLQAASDRHGQDYEMSLGSSAPQLEPERTPWLARSERGSGGITDVQVASSNTEGIFHGATWTRCPQRIGHRGGPCGHDRPRARAILHNRCLRREPAERLVLREGSDRRNEHGGPELRDVHTRRSVRRGGRWQSTDAPSPPR